MVRDMKNRSIIKRMICEMGLLFLFALILRIVFILTLNNTVDVWGDWWDELGVKIATGQGFWVDNPYFQGGTPFYSWRPPGFPLFLACIYRIFGHSYLAAKMGIAVLSALNCLLLFFIASSLLSSSITGIWCALIYAVYPSSVFWTGYLAPVTNEIFMMLLVVLFLIAGEKKKNLFLFVSAGIFTGLGILTRSVFVIFLPAVLIWLIAKNKRFSWRKFIVYTAGTLIAVLPWVVRNYSIHKTFVLTSTEGGIVCYIANNEKSIYQPSGYWDPTGRQDEPVIKDIKGLSEVETDRYFYRAAINFIKKNPCIYWRLVAGRFLRFWRPFPHTFSGPGESYKSYHVRIAMLTNIPIFILAAAGFIFSLKRWREFSIFYLLIILWSAPIILFFKTIIRYREPLMPFFVIFVAVTLSNIFRRVER